MARLLIIEDQPEINELVALNLASLNHQIERCDNGKVGYHRAQNEAFDLIVLDLMLPDMDGLSICQQLRQQGYPTPILMLTARSSEIDRVVGLESGADDYLTKPFSIRELQARVKAQLRRAELSQPTPPSDEEIRFGQLTINPQRRQVAIAGQSIELTGTEFDLLYFLAQHPGRVFSREQLLNNIWGYQHNGYQHTVNSHINRLRSKLESANASQAYVLTVWGVGYKFNDQL
ncbi:response regulator transcription factor [Ferrimonas lipolytica]|uniref:Phosphate regulon transcriptional regulatory protein PhoB n=1 Tax=Ferrimonas lipolytica TaxID=2724191 RepID=A0A6H1UDA8_9GAMM|nr:response regulator transcription factor [Ferrimonas lipolytica]QIZ77024.1 response regulator transcription factor [Ferrimonas lipolytica]